MIQHCGVEDETDIGFYSGLIESLFSVVSMCTMLPLGLLADRFGRKPILITSQLGIAICTVLFGLSTTVWQMLLFRCLAGVFSGSVVAVRSMISEISTKKTQARAFSYFSVAGNIGIMLGPFIGGALATPATQYPGVFGDNQFLRAYPYALANMATGAFAFSAMLLTVFFIEETLTSAVGGAKPSRPMSTWELVKAPGVAFVLFINSMCALIGIGYTALLTIFWYTQPALGGFGFSPLMMSIWLGVGGGAQALWTLLVLPPMHKRYGTIGLLRYSWSAWPVVFAGWIVGNYFLRWGQDTLFWVFTSILWIWGCSIAIGYTGAQLALNDIAPSHNTLGVLNALAMTLGSGIRAIAPALFSSEFAVGVKYQIFGGHLAWVTLILLSLGLRLAVEWLPEKACGRPEKPKQDNDEETAEH